MTTFSICHPLQEIRIHDKGFHQNYVVSLKVYNRAGLYTVAHSDLFKVKTSYKPSKGVVYDVAPQSKDINNADSDYQMIPDMVCAIWRGFIGTTVYNIGVGMLPFTANLYLEKGIKNTSACVRVPPLAPFQKVFTMVEAINEVGKVQVSTDGVQYIDKERYLEQLAIFDGQKCTLGGAITVMNDTELPSGSSINIWYNTTLQVPLEVSLMIKFLPNSTASTKMVTVQGMTICSPSMLFSSLENKILYFKVILLKKKNLITVSNKHSSKLHIVSVDVAPCELDIDHQSSTQTAYGFWTLPKELYKHVSHFKCALQDVNGSLVSPYENTGKSMTCDFIGLDLDIGHKYILNVQICFQHFCLPSVSSDGFTVGSSPPISRHISVKGHYTDSNILTINATWGRFYSLDNPSKVMVEVYEWVLSTSADHPTLDIPWGLTVDDLRSQNINVSISIKYMPCSFCLLI